MTDLPNDGGYTSVMTVVDRFTKLAVFVPLKDTSAVAVAESYFKYVVG